MYLTVSSLRKMSNQASIIAQFTSEYKFGGSMSTTKCGEMKVLENCILAYIRYTRTPDAGLVAASGIM